MRLVSFSLGTLATLAILSPSESTELSLQQHLDLTSDLVAYNTEVATEADSDSVMMAQQVPHQATDRRRVKVYELRANDWFDRGTGFCTAAFATVCSSFVMMARTNFMCL